MSSSQHKPPSLAGLLHKLDAFIVHLTNHLSTYPGIESTLATTLFTLSLVHAQLKHLLHRQRERTALTLAYAAALSARPEESIVATIRSPPPSTRLARLCTSVRNAAQGCDEALVFLRLWGLLQIYGWARETWRRPPQDQVVKACLWGQVLMGAVFQALENAAFLARKGVLGVKDGDGARPRRWVAVGNGVWFVRNALEVGRLVRVKQLGWVDEVEDGGKREGEEKEEEGERWRKNLMFNASWLPIRYHASFEDEEQSPVSETLFGIFGLFPSLIMLRDAWRASA